MNHFGKKVEVDGYKFDSEKEANFYLRFVKTCGKRYEVHKSFELISKFPVGGYKQRSITYAPDFVVYDADGRIEHVYDVKSGITQRAVDTAAKIRFKLFSLKTGLPVEVVVPRKNDFKMKLYGFTTNRMQDPHGRYDRHGNMKRKKNGEPMYDYYDVHKSVNYDIRDTIGW